MSSEHRAPRIIKRDLGRFDERNPGPYTPEPRPHIRDVDPAREDTLGMHNVAKKQRVRNGYAPYPPGSIGKWVEPAERREPVTTDD